MNTLTKQPFYLAVVLGLAFAAFADRSAAQGDVPSVAEVPLASIRDRVVAHSPMLAAARLRIAEARARMKQAGLLSNPEFEAELNHDRTWQERSLTIGLSQAFPITDRLRLEKEVSRAVVATAEAEVRDVARQFVAKAREAAIQQLSLERRKLILLEQMKINRELVDYTSTIAKRAEGSILDTQEAKVENAQLALEVQKIEAEAQQWIAILKPLIGAPAQSEVRVTGTLAPAAIPGDASIDPSQRPDLQAAKSSTNGAGREIALEKAKRHDDISVGLFAEGAREEDVPVGFENEARVGVRVSIPIPWWNKNEGAIEEKKAKRKRLQKEVEALANEIKNEAAGALAEMEAHAKIVADIEKNLAPLADTLVATTETALKKSQTDVQTLLRARNQQVRIRASKLDALRDYNLALVRYESAIAK